MSVYHAVDVCTDTLSGGCWCVQASKHWSGLIADYYGKRVELVMNQAIADAANKQRTPKNVEAKLLADHTYNWTTARNPYPTTPAQDAVTVSQQMHDKYADFFTTC